MIHEYRIALPESKDELGKWMERNGVTLHVACKLGTYHVTVTKRRVLAYNDDTGTHVDTWEHSAYNADLNEAIRVALLQAGLGIGASKVQP